MGLPDFHQIRDRFRQIIQNDNQTAQAGAGLFTLFDYDGVGEILELKLYAQSSGGGINTSNSDNFRVTIDGTDIDSMALYLLFRESNPNIASLFKLLTYRDLAGGVVLFQPHIPFYNNITVKVNKVGVAAYYIGYNYVFGIY